MSRLKSQDPHRILTKLIFRGYEYAELKHLDRIDAAAYIANYLLSEGILVLPCPVKPDIQVKMESYDSVRRTVTYRWQEKYMCQNAEEQAHIYDMWQAEKEKIDAEPLREFADRKLI